MNRTCSATFNVLRPLLLVGAAFALIFGNAESGWSQAKPRPVVVATAKLMRATETVQLTGTVAARRTSRLSSAIGGLVRSITLNLGDRVKVGETIVELDDSLAKHQLAQAQAAVEEARADSLDKRRLLRIGRNLNKRGVVTKDQLNTRRANAQIAQAVVKKLRADEAGKRELVNRHRIVAPFDGVIGQKYVEAGEWVAPGTTIVQLVADQDLWIEVALPQDYYARLSQSTRIALNFAALPGQTFQARRVATSPVSDPRTRTFVLRVAPVAKLAGIAPGMSARAVLTLSTDEDAIVIPKDAVIRHADGSASVWVVGLTSVVENGSAMVTRKKVQLGATFGDQIALTVGLAQGDQVVVGGNESLQSGQRVRITGTGR